MSYIILLNNIRLFNFFVFMDKVIPQFAPPFANFTGMNTKPYIPTEFAGFFYLRGADLLPEVLGETYPHSLTIKQCRALYKNGWLFHSREDALRIREVMKRAYVCEVIRIKGDAGVKVEFVRPLCP